MPPGPALVDDAAIFPPGDAPLHEATAAYGARSAERRRRPGRHASCCATPTCRWCAASAAPLSVVVHRRRRPDRRAGRACARKLGLQLAGLEIALRDLDDLAGNARRVVAAVDAARTRARWPRTSRCTSSCPHVGPTAAWLAAADEVAAAELRLKFRTGGLEAAAFPPAHALAGWIDAALDRETPFKCTAGLHNAVRHTGDDGFEHHGFLNVLVATRRAFDGASPDEVVEVLEQRDGAALAGRRRGARPGRRPALVHLVRLLLGRPSRWPTCASWGSSR